MPCPSQRYWNVPAPDCQLSPGLLDFYRKYNSLQIYYGSILVVMTSLTVCDDCIHDGRSHYNQAYILLSNTANTYLDNSYWPITVSNWKLQQPTDCVKHAEMEMWAEGTQLGLPALGSQHNEQRLQEAGECAGVFLFPPLDQIMDHCHTVWYVLDHAKS